MLTISTAAVVLCIRDPIQLLCSIDSQFVSQLTSS